MTFLFADAASALEDARVGTFCFGVADYVRTYAARETVSLQSSPIFSTVETCTCLLTRLHSLANPVQPRRGWQHT